MYLRCKSSYILSKSLENGRKIEMKRFIFLILAIILVFSAVACSGGIPEETTEAIVETTTAPETEPRPTVVSLLDESGAAIYRVVRPDKGSDSEVQMAIDLKKSLAALTGVDFSLKSDFLMPNESADGVREILIGATNRPESAEALEGLGIDEYVIRVMGDKIIIAGGTDIMTSRAIEAFLALLSAEDGFELSIDLDIKEKVESKNTLFNRHAS